LGGKGREVVTITQSLGRFYGTQVNALLEFPRSKDFVFESVDRISLRVVFHSVAPVVFTLRVYTGSDHLYSKKSSARYKYMKIIKIPIRDVTRPVRVFFDFSRDVNLMLLESVSVVNYCNLTGSRSLPENIDMRTIRDRQHSDSVQGGDAFREMALNKLVEDVLYYPQFDIDNPFIVACRFARGIMEEPILGRVTVMNLDKHIVFDEFVFPDKPVFDYHTQVSGLDVCNMFSGDSRDSVLNRVWSLVGSTSVVGHMLYASGVFFPNVIDLGNLTTEIIRLNYYVKHFFGVMHSYIPIDNDMEAMVDVFFMLRYHFRNKLRIHSMNCVYVLL